MTTSGVFTALPLVVHGPAMLTWDDTEYVRQALNTVDHIDRYGLDSWPGYVVRQQIVKPPLYVNTLAAAVLVLGRDNTTLAAGIVAGVTMMAYGLVVFVSARRLSDEGIAMPLTALMLALPGAMRWFSTAHPDPLLTILLLAAAAMLCFADRPWTHRRSVALGVAVGLALWSKTTAPLFLALPILYWLARGLREGVLAARLRAVALASVVAIAVAAPWYIPHGAGALVYALVSSGFELGDPGDSVFERAWNWLDYIVPRGWGYGAVLLAAVGLIAAALPRPEPATPERPPSRDYLAVFLLGAVPMLALAAISRVPPNTRHVLPALAFVAFGVALFTLTRARARGLLWAAAIALIALQYTVTTMTMAPAVGSAVRREIPAAIGTRVAAATYEYQPVSLDAPAMIVERARVLALEGRPRTWYLSGNSGYVNVSRLRMLANLQNVPVTFDWGTYFTWTPAQRAAMRARLRRESCVVVVYEPSPAISMAQLNVHNDEIKVFVSDPDNGFEPLPELTIVQPGYSVSFFMQRGAVFWKPTR